jgi:hypothetical protein
MTGAFAHLSQPFIRKAMVRGHRNRSDRETDHTWPRLARALLRSLREQKLTVYPPATPAWRGWSPPASCIPARSVIRAAQSIVGCTAAAAAAAAAAARQPGRRSCPSPTDHVRANRVSFLHPRHCWGQLARTARAEVLCRNNAGGRRGGFCLGSCCASRQWPRACARSTPQRTAHSSSKEGQRWWMASRRR